MKTNEIVDEKREDSDSYGKKTIPREQDFDPVSVCVGSQEMSFPWPGVASDFSVERGVGILPADLQSDSFLRRVSADGIALGSLSYHAFEDLPEKPKEKKLDYKFFAEKLREQMSKLDSQLKELFENYQNFYASLLEKTEELITRASFVEKSILEARHAEITREWEGLEKNMGKDKVFLLDALTDDLWITSSDDFFKKYYLAMTNIKQRIERQEKDWRNLSSASDGKIQEKPLSEVASSANLITSSHRPSFCSRQRKNPLYRNPAEECILKIICETPHRAMTKVALENRISAMCRFVDMGRFFDPGSLEAILEGLEKRGFINIEGDNILITEDSFLSKRRKRRKLSEKTNPPLSQNPIELFKRISQTLIEYKEYQKRMESQYKGLCKDGEHDHKELVVDEASLKIKEAYDLALEKMGQLNKKMHPLDNPIKKIKEQPASCKGAAKKGLSVFSFKLRAGDISFERINQSVGVSGARSAKRAMPLLSDLQAEFEAINAEICSLKQRWEDAIPQEERSIIYRG